MASDHHLDHPMEHPMTASLGTAFTVSQAALDAAYPLTPEQKVRFREDGFVRLAGVFDTDTLVAFEREISRVTFAENPLDGVPMHERTTYGKAFIQVFNLWTKSPEARRLSFSKRLAGIATELLDTQGVRMWHDQSLYKEPSGGFTPWHADQQYWPMSSGLCVTAWIPLHAVPLEQGPLSFGKGSHLKKIGRDLEISDDSEKMIREELAREGVVEVAEPYAAGDVSFHLGWAAGPPGRPTATAMPTRSACLPR